MKCTSCNAYYRRNPWNTSNYCETCLDAEEDSEYNTDTDDKVEIDSLLNPTGKTPARFYD